MAPYKFGNNVQLRLSEKKDDQRIYELLYYDNAVVVANRLTWTHIIGKECWLIKFIYIGVISIIVSCGQNITYTILAALPCPILLVWFCFRYVWLSSIWPTSFHEQPHFSSYWNSGKKGRGLWVTTKDDTVVGCIALDYSNPTTCEVFRVAVDNQYRGQGIAKQMMHFVMDKSATEGIKDMIVVTSHVQYEAQALYEKMGFYCYKVDRDMILVGVHFFRYNLSMYKPTSTSVKSS